MQFSDVIGLQEVKKQLAGMVHHNRLSHALLFLGKEGNGSLPLALAFAQYMVCEKVSRQSAPSTSSGAGSSLFGEEPLVEKITSEPIWDSCGVCPSCMKAAKMIHPDIHYSYPTVTKKAGEKPVATDFINEWRQFMEETPYGNIFDWTEAIKEKDNSQAKITAAECNDIIHKLNLKSFESGYKILVLWAPELMGKEGNILLKLIEEPPPDSLFILVTENEPLVLPTIVSRCQLIPVPSLTINDIEEALIKIKKTEPGIARQVAGTSEGDYREALRALEDAEEDWQLLLRDWLNAIIKTGPLAQAKWVEEAGALGREKQKQFLRYFNHLLQQAVRIRILGPGAEAGQAIHGKEKDFAERLNAIAGIEQQQAIIEELDKASYYIERNAHGKMLFHALTIKLYHIIQDKIVFLTD